MTAPADARLTFDQASTPDPRGWLQVGAHWSGFGGAHGGLMVAAAARAMAQVVPQSDWPLRAIHADFHGGAAPGQLEFDARLDRAGRSVAFTRTTAAQAGRTRLAATAVFGAAAAGHDYAPVTRAVRPDAPGPDELPRWDAGGGPALPTVEFRPARAPLPLAGARVADLLCWIRIDDCELWNEAGDLIALARQTRRELVAP